MGLSHVQRPELTPPPRRMAMVTDAARHPQKSGQKPMPNYACIGNRAPRHH
jgi:hypothetical protein